jgi:acyl carrier protein
MTNINKYKEIFREVMEINTDEVEKMKYKDGKWDSVGHMVLISELEEKFGLEFEPEDIVGLDSYEKGIEILKKYGIDL